MPQAIAAAIVAAIGITGVAATIATAVIALAISVGLNYIAQQIFGKSGTAKPSDGQQVIRQAVASRVRHYGTVRVGGVLSFYESRNGTLYFVVTTGHGKVNGVIDYVINGKSATVDGSGRITSMSYTHKGTTYYPVSIFFKDGDPNQTAFSQLTSVFTEWTTNHRQRGCSALLLVCGGTKQEYFADVYEGSRQPEPTLTLEASLVYDPRLDSTQIIGYSGGSPVYGSGAHRKDDETTWAFTENWALNFADYLAHEDGYGAGVTMINWTNVAQEADICDETVTTVDSRVIPKWRACGSYRLAEDERRAIVAEFLKCADGFMWQDADGLINIQSGRWIEPTVHITDKHILSCTASIGADPQDRANEVRVVYTEPLFDYTETEADPTIDAAARAIVGRAEVQRFDAYYCPDHNQAKRLGKRILAKLLDRWVLNLKTNLYGLNAIGERFIYVTIVELDIIEVAFEITALKLDPGSNTLTIGLVEVREADFTFDPAEEGQPPSIPGSTAIAVTIDPPDNLTLYVVQVALDGVNGVGILADWDSPGRIDLFYQVQYRPTGETVWLEMTVSQDDLTAITGIISSGIEYEVQARSITISGRTSDWTAIETITPTVEAVVPSTPTAFNATGGAGSASITWRNPNESSFSYTRLLRNTVNTFGTATEIQTNYGGLGEVMNVTDSPAAGTYYYWVVAYNAGAFASAPTSSDSAVVT